MFTLWLFALTLLIPKPRCSKKKLTLCLEGKVVGQVSALVVSAQEKQGVGIPNLEGPQVQDTLKPTQLWRQKSQIMFSNIYRKREKNVG